MCGSTISGQAQRILCVQLESRMQNYSRDWAKKKKKKTTQTKYFFTNSEINNNSLIVLPLRALPLLFSAIVCLIYENKNKEDGENLRCEQHTLITSYYFALKLTLTFV